MSAGKKYGVRVVAALTDYGRSNPGTIGLWWHKMGFERKETIFNTEAEAVKALAATYSLNKLDFQWAAIPITKEECRRLRGKK